MRSIEKTVRFYSDPAEADRDDQIYLMSLSAQQRLDLMLDMCRRWGKTNERRFERVIEIVQFQGD